MKSRWKKGDVFGRTGFKIIDIKEGGMGIVYIIVHPILRFEIYAVKSFKDEFMRDERIVRRFWYEAQKWVELGKHENVVYADHIFEVEGKPYIYLEFVKGNNLRHYIERRMLDLNQSLEFALQFCAGMEFVRQTTKGLVHRDIKPENCLITEDKTLKITDWGLAKAFDDIHDLSKLNPNISLSSMHSGSLYSTDAGVVMGTPPYMSPEQYRGEKDLDVTSDIYQFGCMLYEMISGSPPFECENFIEYMAHHLKAKPEPINGISGELNAILMKCLEKEPRKRFTNFGELGDAILKVAHKKSKNISEMVKGGEKPLGSKELTQKGFGLLHLRRDIEAIEFFDRAIALNPNNFEALGYKGYCLGNLGRHKEAIEVCERAVRINPNFAHAWGNLGFSYCGLGEFERGVECYNRAIQLDPDDITHHNNRAIAFMDWGDSGKDHRKYEEAVRCADLGLKIDPRYYRLWVTKGHCLRKMGRHKDAIRSYEEAVNINPRALPALAGLAMCYNEIGDKETAVKYYLLAKQIDRDFTT